MKEQGNMAGKPDLTNHFLLEVVVKNSYLSSNIKSSKTFITMVDIT